MADELDLYYWDACIFYEFLNKDQTHEGRAAAVRQLAEQNRRKTNRICTSVVTHIEVIPNKIDPAVEKTYYDLFNSMFFFDVELSRPIVSLSREIKDYYYQPKNPPENHKMLGTGDAIHLATAIIENVTHLHTRDGKRKGGNVPLLGLAESSAHGKICGKYPLKVVDPEIFDLFPSG